MGRCPKFLELSGFERLATAMGTTLSDDGISSLGEITEFIAQQIIAKAHDKNSGSYIDMQAIVSSAESLGIELDLDWQQKIVKNVKL